MPQQKSGQPRKKKKRPVLREDASRKEVILYAFGNIEASIADQFFIILQNVMVVAMHVNPLLIGMVLGIKTLWDSVTDPIMAHITDNTKSRWGRRRPYILVGGVSRILLLVAIVAFMPSGGHMTTNTVMESQKHVNDMVKETRSAQKTTIQTYEQISSAQPKIRDAMLSILKNIPATTLEASHKLEKHLAILQDDLINRRFEAEQKQKKFEDLSQGKTSTEKALTTARGVAELSKEKVQKAEKLINKGIEAQRKAISAGYAALYILANENTLSYKNLSSPETSQQTANQAFNDAGLTPLPLSEMPAYNKKTSTVRYKIKTLFTFTKNKQRKAIGNNYAAYQTYVSNGNLATQQPSPQRSQEAADQACAKLKISPLNLFAMEKEKPPEKWKQKTARDNIKAGLNEFFEPRNVEQRNLIIYVLFSFLLFTTLSTIQGIPYYALGIELSPSYDGRTQVVIYRAIMNKIAGLLQPWIPVFCFSLFFTTATKGLFWISIVACIIGIPSTVLMCWFTKERTDFTPPKKRTNLFKSMWAIACNGAFLRVFALYTLVSMTVGIFMQLGFYLNVYWVMGSALSGAKLGAYISMLAWGLSFIMLPIINWACRKYEKHNFLRFAIIWMSIGAALHWWCMNPEHPEYQFILPFFYSVGISSVFTVLPTMMADVTDVDELKHNLRREGMFGAVMAFLMKFTGTLTPILSGVVLVMSGFDAHLEYEQAPSTITHLRIIYSFIPAGMLLTALILLFKYPLTRARVINIKKQLEQRRQATDAEYSNTPYNLTEKNT